MAGKQSPMNARDFKLVYVFYKLFTAFLGLRLIKKPMVENKSQKTVIISSFSTVILLLLNNARSKNMPNKIYTQYF